jgi:hypothetical protein
MATFILIPGGWQGGWAYEKVANLLIARGHKAQALTLAGLGEDPAPAANLATHIDETVQAIDLSGRWRQVPRKVYVGAHGWEGSPFLDLFERLSADPEWKTFALDCGHNIARLEPEALAGILLAQV